MKSEPIKVLDVVALTQPLPEKNLKQGQVGTVVEQWAPDVWEVEFSDTRGVAHAMVSLKAEQLMVLHYDFAAAR